MKHRVRGVSIFKPARRNTRSHPYLLAWGAKHDRSVITGSADLQVCIELASKIAGIVDRTKHGLADPDAARHFVEARRTLTQHLDDYESAMVNQGGSKKHAFQMRTYAETILDFSGAKHIADLIPSRLQSQLAKIKGSETTRKRYFDALHGFLAWGVSDRRWPSATLSIMPQMRYAKNPVLRRRVISLEQLGHLIDVTEASDKTAEKIVGTERALIYLTVAATALRAGEMTRLTCADVGESGVYVMGKNKERTLIIVPAALLDRIAAHAEGRTGKLFNMPWNPARMLRHDLKVAGIPFKTADGVFDFHALRHQSGTILASAGVPPKAVQRHMRHSDIRLTLDTYGHLLDSDRVKAQDAIRSAIGVQRLAQRIGFSDVRRGSPKGKESPVKTEDNRLERRGIEPRFAECDSAVTIQIARPHRELINQRGKRVAPGVAQRLLHRLYKRAVGARRDGRGK